MTRIVSYLKRIWTSALKLTKVPPLPKTIILNLLCLDIFPVASGAEAEDTTSKFLYAVVEILLDFINQTNDRDTPVIDFHHPSQITKAMDFSLPDYPLPLEQLVADCRTALK